MRMYLSSYKFGKHIDKLKKLAFDTKKVAIIMNAVDFGDQERITKSVNKIKDTLSDLGFIGERLDLRKYFSKEVELENCLKEYGMVWVYGGNAFILKRAYEQSGFDNILKKRLKEDSLVYAGFSAAIVVITPTLRGVDIVDDPSVVPVGYKEQVSLEGMGLLKYVVAPHYQSDHSESNLMNKYIKYCDKKNIPCKPLHDGEVIVIDGDKEITMK